MRGRSPARRFKRWTKKMDGSTYARILERVKPVVEGEVARYQVDHERMISIVKQVLSKRGLPACDVAKYVWFAQQVWEAAQRFKEKALRKQLDALMLYWGFHGLDEAACMEICRALGVECRSTDAIVAEWKAMAPAPPPPQLVPHSLDDHTDVEIVDPSHLESLVYDTYTGAWRNLAPLKLVAEFDMRGAATGFSDTYPYAILMSPPIEPFEYSSERDLVYVEFLLRTTFHLSGLTAGALVFVGTYLYSIIFYDIDGNEVRFETPSNNGMLPGSVVDVAQADTMDLDVTLSLLIPSPATLPYSPYENLITSCDLVVVFWHLLVSTGSLTIDGVDVLSPAVIRVWKRRIW